ncbi:MAG: DUF4363 family protein [Bacteroidota bacterium]
MKVWLLSLGCLISFIVGGYLIQSMLDRTAAQLNQELGEVELKLNAGDWDQSLLKLKTVRKNWEKVKPYWAILTNHKEMDLIEEALIKTIRAALCKSYNDAMINLGSLRDSIKHIPERERFSLVNVF